MPSSEHRPVASGGGLSKDRVVTEAIRLADRDGVTPLQHAL